MRYKMLPGCCGVGVIYDLSSGSLARVKQDLDYYEREAAQVGRYTFAIATTTTHQKIPIQALKEAGWKQMRRFRSRSTRAKIIVWGKMIRK